MYTVSHSTARILSGALDIIVPQMRNQNKLLLDTHLAVVFLYNHRPCKSWVKLSTEQS